MSLIFIFFWMPLIALAARPGVSGTGAAFLTGLVISIIASVIFMQILKRLARRYTIELMHDRIRLTRTDRDEAIREVLFSDIKDYRGLIHRNKEGLQIRVYNGSGNIDVMRATGPLSAIRDFGVLVKVADELEQNLNAYYAVHPEIVKAKRIRSAF